MPLRLRGALLACLSLVVAWPVLSTFASAQTVFSGLTYSFTRPPNVDGNDPQNQDAITPNVIFARQSQQGLYNAAYEDLYEVDYSPHLTEWATDVIPGNAGQEISATNWAALTFTDWKTAYGGGSGELGRNILNRSAVVHLIGEDTYIDLRFDSWSVFSGGGFGYMRSTIPVVTPTGDYSGNGVVDAADYALWRDTLGQIILPGRGADGDGSGIIDAGDFDFWKRRFGTVIPGSGSGAVTVPEPGTLALTIFAFAMAPAIVGLTRRRC